MSYKQHYRHYRIRFEVTLLFGTIITTVETHTIVIQQYYNFVIISSVYSSL